MMLTFTEYLNQKDPEWMPFVEVTEADAIEVQHNAVAPYEKIVWLHAKGRNSPAIAYVKKSGSNILYVPDPEGDTGKDRVSCFHWVKG